ncbi:CobW family GTP-binding protein [Cohnella silvisoli]|uniref:GTP-binding protein n=1 Tax=Cohnella silvisoli TaxID=2873699 RepID=A0ABV1KQZ8_9BACL|nr:GTP-binding protein [Cohnella silvisoli]MCD9024562.1 GTP-binding protein [Cohnella silvisoli]
MTNPIVPIHVLTGFLGSGKTTVLLALLERLKAEGKRPAVIINEFGDADVDGLLVQDDIPTESMLGGCICCTIRGDLSMTILDLYERYNPDILLIEATGAAHPAEIIEGVSDASLLTRTELRTIVNVIDARMLLDTYTQSTNREARLYKSQIQTAGWLLLNKIDRVPIESLPELEKWIRQYNEHAPLVATIKGSEGLGFMDSHTQVNPGDIVAQREGAADLAMEEDGEDSHSSLTVKTYYLDEPIDRQSFQSACLSLPHGLHRMKGIVRFAGEQGLHLIQYAYRELEMMPIQPQKAVQEVLVVIGESDALSEANEAMLEIIGF